jgi:hypothetical protein
MFPFYLRKWYLDLISDDGIVLYLYFIATRIAGIPGGNVSAHVVLADGKELGAVLNRRVTLLDSKQSAACALNRLANPSGRSHAHLEFPRLAIDLDYRARTGAWTPKNGGVLLQQNSARLSWNVPLPAADVEGAIRTDVQEWRVRGTGYQDLVEVTIPPWRLPIAELVWGRAHCGVYTVVFDQLKLRDGTCLQYLLLQADRTAAPREFQAYDIESDPGDRKCVLRHKDFVLNLTQKRILAQGEIASGGQIRSMWMRTTLARSSGNPFEKKMISAAELFIGERSVSGWAIHERVTWHWKGNR